MVDKKGGNILPASNSMQINFKGIFHFENLYKMMHDWLTSKGYKHYPTKSDNIEDYYQEYILSNGAKNNWIWWRTKKEENDMFNYYIDVNIQILVMTSKEVVYKGEKLKMNDAEISIFVTSYIEVDPSGQWKTNNFMKKMFNLYKEKEFIAIIDDKESDVCMQAAVLFERAKQYLNLMTAMPLEKPFHPELGYPQL